MLPKLAAFQIFGGKGENFQVRRKLIRLLISDREQWLEPLSSKKSSEYSIGIVERYYFVLLDFIKYWTIWKGLKNNTSR